MTNFHLFINYLIFCLNKLFLAEFPVVSRLLGVRVEDFFSFKADIWALP